MATNYTNDSITLTVGGSSKSSKYSTSATATLSVWSSGSTIKWKVSMSTSNYPYVYFYLRIGSKVLYEGYYADDPTNYGPEGFIQTGYKAFPRGNGSSASNSFEDTTSNTLGISMWVGPSVWYDYSRDVKYNQTYRCYAGYTTLNRLCYEAGNNPSLSVTNNGNNTCTMTWYTGKDGTNNNLDCSTLYWTTNGLNPADGTSYTSNERKWDSGGDINNKTYYKTLSVKEKTTVTGVVWSYYSAAGNVCNSGGNIAAEVPYYAAPSAPGKPIIGYTKSRLTIKEPWNINWSAATPANEDSPIAGYRVRLYKNGITIPIIDPEGNRLISSTNTQDCYFDTESDSTLLTIDPKLCGIEAKDKVKFSVIAYARNGKGDIIWKTEVRATTSTSSNVTKTTWNLFSNNGDTDKASFSEETLVQNAGVVKLKVSNTGIPTKDWKEGNVFIKVSNTGNDSIDWREAETVKVKVSNTGNNDIDWKESE